MNYAYNPNPAPVSAPRKSVSACGVVGFILAVLTFVFYIVGSLATEKGFLLVIDCLSYGLEGIEVAAGDLLLLVSTLVLFGTSFAAIKGNTAVPAIAGIFYFIAMLFNQLHVLSLDFWLKWIFEYSVGHAVLLVGLVLAFLIGVCFLFFAKNLGCKIVSAIMFAAVLLVPLFVKDNFFGPSVTELGTGWFGKSFAVGWLIYQLSVRVLPYAAFLMIALGGKKQNSSKPQQFYVPRPQQIPYGVPQQPNVYGAPQPQQIPYGVPQQPNVYGVPQPQQIPHGVPQQPNVYGVPQPQQIPYGVPQQPNVYGVPQPQQIPYGVPQQPNVYGVPAVEPAEPVADPVEPLEQPAPAPVADSVAEPIAVPTEQPAYEPTAAPTVELTPELKPEPTAEPASEPAPEPASEPVADPVADPVEPLEQPAPAPVAEPIAVPTEQPAYEPTAAPTVELTPELKPEPTAEPAPEPAPEPVADPVVQQTPKFVMTEEKAAKLRVLFAKKTNGEITEEQFKELRNELFK